MLNTSPQYIIVPSRALSDQNSEVDIATWIIVYELCFVFYIFFNFLSVLNWIMTTDWSSTILWIILAQLFSFMAYYKPILHVCIIFNLDTINHQYSHAKNTK